MLKLAAPIRSRPWAGLLLAVALPFLALAVRLQIFGETTSYPFLTFFVAVLVAAFLGGLWPGIVAAALSALLTIYFLIPPAGSFKLVWGSGAVGLGFYAIVAALIIGLIETAMRASASRLASRDALIELNAQLESLVEERTAELRHEAEERARAQNQVRQLQKMEAVGQLTGGIAHDFNNMLAVIIGSLDLAKRRLAGTEHPKLAQSIENAREAAERAATLTAQLLAFSRQQPLNPGVVEANRVVRGMSDLLRRTLGETIALETALADGLWRCFADPAQLENAILNLAINSRDAMPGGGRLTIETANSELDALYARAHAEVGAGDYVMISVTDTGTGMDAETLERAFDPFFTTKEIGKGTGLGLSQVHGYVKQSGGHAKIYSEPGRGTTVKLYLPRDLGTDAPAEEAVRARVETPLGSPETVVVVVEDEEAVRAMTIEALADLGYSVLHAANGEEALGVLAGAMRVDLLLTDVVMPGMDGRDLADAARQRWPGLRVIFTTGYTRNAVVQNGVLDAGVEFLAKPFTVHQLAIKVAEVLAKPGA